MKTVRQLIAGLKYAGVQRGDTVCIHSFNSLLYPLLILAIIGVGGLSTGTNPSYTKSELSHAVKIAKVKFVLAEPEILSNMQTALSENGIDVGSKLFVLDSLSNQTIPQGYKSWRTLLQHGEADWIRFDNERQQVDTVAQLYYTSGTTGLPKCAMSTHRNLVAEHSLFYGNNPRDYPYRVVLAMPFFHAGIASQVFISVLKEGRHGYVMRRFELEPFLSYHTKYQLTEVFMVPPMVNAIVMSGYADEKSKTYRKNLSLRSVRNGTVGAAPCSGDLQSRFQKLLAPGATYTQVWGMTETNSMACIVPWDIARSCSTGEVDAWGTVGVPLPCNQMKLVDENGKDVTDSGKGELCVKGPTVVKGYLENEKATADSWDEEGYFKTGDVIEVRKQAGYDLMYVVERLKELIKVRGFQVAPAELEGALTEHSGISDAAVIGLSGGDDGNELPMAFVVRKEGSNVTEKEIMAHMKERLSRYKQLEGGIEFLNEIPKLPSGKILKRVLREEAKKIVAKRGGKSKL